MLSVALLQTPAQLPLTLPLISLHRILFAAFTGSLFVATTKLAQQRLALRVQSDPNATFAGVKYSHPAS